MFRGPAHIVMLTIFFATASRSHGQDVIRLGNPSVGAVMRLTLEQARELAIGNNKELELGRLNTIEKNYATGAARTYYLPQIIGTIGYLHFNEDLGQVVTVRRRTLGPIALGGNTITANLINQDSTVAGVTVLQPITKLITIHAAVQIAQADEGIAHAQLEKGLRDVVSGVTQTYHGLIGLRRLEHAIALQLDVAKKFQAAKPNPALRIQIVQGEKGLLEVRGKIAELSDQLAHLLNLSPCTIFELEEPLPRELPLRCADDAVQLALADHPELREANETIVKADNALRIARTDLLPDVNLLGGVYYQKATDVIQDDFALIGVAATYDFGWGRKLKVKHQRMTQVEMAQQNLQVAIDKVAQEARKAYREYEQAQQALHLAEENVQAYKAVAQAANDPMTMLTAAANTAQAELERIQAELDYRLAHAKLLAATGQQ